MLLKAWHHGTVQIRALAHPSSALQTLARELKGADLGMQRFGLNEAMLITLHGSSEHVTEHGVVHEIPAWKWCLG